MRTVLITGGGKGLGRTIAQTYAANGDTVFINYLQDESSAFETLNTILSNGGKAKLIQTDIGNRDNIQNMFDQLPGIDIFIHNAVYPVSARVEDMTEKDWERAFAVNASALLYISQYCFPHMKANGYGRIFGISSSGGKRGIPNYLGVGVGKAAMEAMIRYLAVEWGAYGITANSVSPGAMDTEAFRTVFPNAKERLEYIQAKAPRRQTVKFEEVSELLLQLSRQEMGMITGQDIVMDGGFTLLT
jgi:enoyl-[acyl-carrier protein] reductase III